MIVVMILLSLAGVGLVIYAASGVFSAKPETGPRLRTAQPPKEDAGKEQKIQRLQTQLAELDTQFKNSQAEYANEESEFMKLKESEARLSEELKRRDEWLAKTEGELTKIRAENTELSSQFIAKEKELEKEFTTNVNLARHLNELKAVLAEKESSLRAKDDQLEAQKHQIEDQLKTIKEQLSAISEFKKKEKISEWVPKSEFNRLNEEYSELEKELESSQERLKAFAEEITHLRQEINRKNPAPAHPPVVEQEAINRPAEAAGIDEPSAASEQVEKNKLEENGPLEDNVGQPQQDKPAEQKGDSQ